MGQRRGTGFEYAKRLEHFQSAISSAVFYVYCGAKL
jgi:hypothetical protein